MSESQRWLSGLALLRAQPTHVWTGGGAGGPTPSIVETEGQGALKGKNVRPLSKP